MVAIFLIPFLSWSLHRIGALADSQGITFGVLVSTVISISVFRKDQISLASSINKQVQDFNLSIMKDDGLSHFVADRSFPGKGKEWVKNLYAAFYLINVVRESRELGRGMAVDEKLLFSKQEMVRLIAKDYPQQISYILTHDRGYPEDFKGYIRASLKLPKGDDSEKAILTAVSSARV